VWSGPSARLVGPVEEKMPSEAYGAAEIEGGDLLGGSRVGGCLRAISRDRRVATGDPGAGGTTLWKALAVHSW
jgi:hypothetical protein